ARRGGAAGGCRRIRNPRTRKGATTVTRAALRLPSAFLLLALAVTGAPRADAAAPSPAVVAAVGTPPPGKALVVFFRPSKFVAGGVGFKVREGEKVLGKLGNGKYFVSTVAPGAHTYVVHSEA